jgi:hypothetical protein
MFMAAPQWREPVGAARGLRVLVHGLRPQHGHGELVVAEVPGATACTCCAVTARRRWIRRSPASSGRPSAHWLPSSRAWFITESSLYTSPATQRVLTRLSSASVTPPGPRAPPARAGPPPPVRGLAGRGHAVQHKHLRAAAPQAVVRAGAVGHAVRPLLQRAVQPRAGVAVQHGGQHRQRQGIVSLGGRLEGAQLRHLERHGHIGLLGRRLELNAADAGLHGLGARLARGTARAGMTP